jgi:hypothetical protein
LTGFGGVPGVVAHFISPGFLKIKCSSFADLNHRHLQAGFGITHGRG